MGAKKIIILAVVLALAIFKLFGLEFDKQGTPITSGVVIKVLDIGQGDAILIFSGKETVLVDSGDIGERDKLLELLKKEKVTTIDLLVSTHPHADHIGGMDMVLKNFTVKKVLDSGFAHTSKTYIDYLKTIKNKNIPFEKAKQGSEYKLGDGVVLQVLAPFPAFLKDTNGDLNNNSIVLRLVKGDFSMLLTGDIQKEAEHKLVREFKSNLKSDVLKSPHHSSRTSSTIEFLNAVDAKDVIISCAKVNDYGFPKKEIIKSYKNHNMNVYITADDGTVVVQSDGKNYKISKRG